MLKIIPQWESPKEIIIYNSIHFWMWREICMGTETQREGKYE
jgi:hypothetical protein